MNGWLPLIRAVMPHLAQIVTAAAPAFTARPGMTAQQINELQAAVRRNDESIRVLAEQAQQLTKGLDELNAATQQTVKQLQTVRRMAIAGLAAAILAGALAIILLVIR